VSIAIEARTLKHVVALATDACLPQGHEARPSSPGYAPHQTVEDRTASHHSPTALVKQPHSPYYGIKHSTTSAEFSKIYNSKDGKTEELWTIVESMIWWMVEEPHAPWHMIDDGERSMFTHSLLGYMLLAVLNRIDQEGDFQDRL
jgi:hypothetical protein